MIKEELQQEYDKLVFICGNAMMHRISFLNQEIRNLQSKEIEDKKKKEKEVEK